MEFNKLKIQRLKTADLSRKGSIDKEIVELVRFINEHKNFFTTSSCSGRIAIFSESSENSKKGCQWLYTTHELADIVQVKSSIYDDPIASSAVFKFEPFVLHVQCKTLDDAKLMHQAAVASGFRNSGITIGKNNKIIMAVRSTHGLEAPLADNGIVLVSSDYISHLVKVANSKMEENVIRIERFFSNLKIAMELQTQDGQKRCKQVRKQFGPANSTRTVKDNATQCRLRTSCNHGNQLCAGNSDGMSKKLHKQEQISGSKVEGAGVLEGAIRNTDGHETSIPSDVLDDLGNSLRFLDVES